MKTKKTKSVRQKATINAKPSEVYEALMNSKKHAKFTGAPAKIGSKVGDKFTAYGGYVEGKNLNLIKNKKIVQAWRGSEWEKGHFSKITYNLKPVKTGTRIFFYQSGIPEKEFKHIKKGWIQHYWTPLKKMFTK
jgi:activator of HSP90 ATPase